MPRAQAQLPSLSLAVPTGVGQSSILGTYGTPVAYELNGARGQRTRVWLRWLFSSKILVLSKWRQKWLKNVDFVVVKAQRCSRQDTEERKEPTVILAAWCMIWQIDAAVVDALFWGTSFTTQQVKLAAARSVEKRANNSSFLHN